jgi:hypothetical protein
LPVIVAEDRSPAWCVAPVGRWKKWIVWEPSLQ